MNTLNLDSATMQNKPTIDMENIILTDKVYNANHKLIFALDKRGNAYNFDENGTLINKKRLYSKRRNWDMLWPTHGEHYGMTVLISRLDDWEYDKELLKGSHEPKILIAYQKDGNTKWTLVDGEYIDQDEDLANWFDLQGYMY